jgi:DNA-binding transcriptional regulator PaaX
MLSSGIFLSSKVGAPFDHLAVRALAAGCWALCPHVGVYSELMPEMMHSPCLYDYSPDTLAGRMQDVWHLDHLHNYEYALSDLLKKFDPVVACKAMDERLEELVIAHSVLGSLNQPTQPTTPGASGPK